MVSFSLSLSLSLPPLSLSLARALCLCMCVSVCVCVCVYVCVQAITIMTRLCHVALTRVQSEWFVATAVRVHGLGWGEYDPYMEGGLVELLEAALLTAGPLLASRHTALMHKVVKHACSSGSAYVRGKGFTTLLRCLQLHERTGEGVEGGGMQTTGTVPSRAPAQELGCGGVGRAGYMHTRAIIKSAMRPIMSALLPDMPVRLAPSGTGTPAGGPSGQRAEVIAHQSTEHPLNLTQVWLVAERMMLPGGLNPREQGGLGSAMLRAAVAVLQRGEEGVHVKVLICHVMSRLLVAGVLQDTQLDLLDEITKGWTGGGGTSATPNTHTQPSNSRLSSPFLGAALLQMQVTRIYTTATLGAPGMAAQRVSTQVLARLRTACSPTLMPAAEVAAVILVGRFMTVPYAVRMVFHELHLELDRSAKGLTCRPPNMLLLGRVLLLTVARGPEGACSVYGAVSSAHSVAAGGGAWHGSGSGGGTGGGGGDGEGFRQGREGGGGGGGAHGDAATAVQGGHVWGEGGGGKGGSEGAGGGVLGGGGAGGEQGGGMPGKLEQDR